MTSLSLNLGQFIALSSDEACVLIDIRSQEAFLEGYIPNSIHFKPEIINQAAALGLLSFETPLLFVGLNSQDAVVIPYFKELGFKNIKGFLEGGFPTWLSAQKRIDLIIEVEPDELAMDIPFDEYLMILDIRTEEEYNKGHLKNSVHLPLLDFADPGSMSELDEHFNIYILSQDGETNTLAASILKKQGIHNIRVVKEGWKAIMIPELKDKFKIEITKDKTATKEDDLFL